MTSLRQDCKRFGLSTTGTREVLVSRLNNYFKEQDRKEDEEKQRNEIRSMTIEERLERLEEMILDQQKTIVEQRLRIEDLEAKTSKEETSW